MDISKEYIKMCEKAEEIQKLFNPDEFNFLWDFTLRNDWDKNKYRYINYKPEMEGKNYSIGGQHRFDTNDGYSWHCIWLPRQDQLQEIVEDCFLDYIRDMKFNSTIFMIQKFEEFCQVKNEDCFSLEQYWLEFLMKEKYNKIWNGKEWEKVK